MHPHSPSLLCRCPLSRNHRLRRNEEPLPLHVSFCHSRRHFVQPTHSVARHLSFWSSVIYDGSHHFVTVPADNAPAAFVLSSGIAGDIRSWSGSCLLSSPGDNCRRYTSTLQLWYLKSVFLSTCPTYITVSAWQGHLFSCKRAKNSKDFLPETF